MYVQETNITYNSITISWSTSLQSWTYLRYRRKGTSDSWQDIQFENFFTSHEANLTGFNADTEFEYNIGIRIDGEDALNKSAYTDTFKTDILRTIKVTAPVDKADIFPPFNSSSN